MASIIVSTVVALTAALAAHQPNDTIQMQGTFPGFVLTKPHDVTLDATGAQLASVYMDGAQNVTLLRPKVTVADANWKGGIYVVRSDHVTVDHADVEGGIAPVAITFRDSTNVALLNSVIHRGYVALAVMGVTGFKIDGSSFLDGHRDGMNISGSANGAITRNVCAGVVVDPPGDHPDCVQIIGPNTLYPFLSHDLEIAFNLVHGDYQGIDCFQGCRDVEAHDNEIVASHSHGLAFYDSYNIRAWHNRMTTLDGADYQTSLNVVRPGVNVVVCDNQIEAYRIWKARADPACPAN